MPKSRGKKETQLRQQLAQEAARLMAEQGIRDFFKAKTKAAQRLGITGREYLPSNAEIQAALCTYQNLFQSQSQPQQLRRLRTVAREGMRFLQVFKPRLVGSVLLGTAGPHSDVNLHLFADTAEQVALFLMEQGIPYQVNQRQARYKNERTETTTLYRFFAEEVAVELMVFPLLGLREAPKSTLDGAPVRRMTLAELEALLETEGPSANDMSEG